MTPNLPTPRPSDQIQRLSLGPVTAGALVVALGLWLLERGQEPTHMIWVGVAMIAGPWLPLALHHLALARRWASLPEVQIVDAFGPLLAPAVERHGLRVVLKVVKTALAEMGGSDGER